MIIPGANLLRMALGVIAPQPVMFFKWASRTQNAIGNWTNTYAAGVSVPLSSVQAISRDRYQMLGLDASRDYISWFVDSAQVLPVARDATADQFQWGGKRYDVQKVTDWLQQDGWKWVIGCAITN